MKLHCMICSLQGTHRSADSEIAIIDKAKLQLPLTPDMFSSINPERGYPEPWLPGVDWQTMWCPRGRSHLPWGIDYKDIEQAIKEGGPRQLLTDEGMVDVPRDKPEGMIEDAPPSTEQNPNLQTFTCEKCGREIRSRLAFANHQKACKGRPDA